MRVRKTRQFLHTNSGGKKSIDIYPEIDQYIPVAVTVANTKANKIKDRLAWDYEFLAAMDSVLKKEGLRI